MKKILIGAACLFALSSCDLDINEDPNYPKDSDLTPTLIFPAVENALAVVPGDAMFTDAGFFMQYFEQMPEANQYNDIAELHFDEASQLFDRSYTSIYARALMDIKQIQGLTTNTADLFACTVLRAQCFQYMVDAMSDAPYSEALQGNGNPTPKWEDGQTVFEGVLKELDDAEQALSVSDEIDMSDPMLGGDLDKWKQYANLIRLRIYMRFIDGGVDASNYTAKAKAIVAEGNLPTDDVTFDVYSNADGQFNPWYDTYYSLSTNNFVAGYPLVAYYKATADPRISYAIKKSVNTKDYEGQLPGSKTLYKEWGKNLKNDDISNIDVSVAAAMPIYLATASEVEFLKAEVELRFNGNASAAKTAYEAAVTADFNSRGTAGVAEFLAARSVNFDAQANDAAKLKLIYMQKWVSFFYRNHMEAWAEQRRVDVPAKTSLTTANVYGDDTNYSAGDLFSPGLNYYGNGDVCKRLPYPLSARQLNSNTPTVKTLADRVFWDAK